VTREYKIAVIGGDGIGPEVTNIALEAINRVTAGSGVTFKTTEYDLGATRPARL
jgi:3-isopropylmalate dehydrogenase